MPCLSCSLSSRINRAQRSVTVARQTIIPSIKVNTLCLRKKTSRPFLFLCYLCQMSFDFANFWQKQPPGNLLHASDCLSVKNWQFLPIAVLIPLCRYNCTSANECGIMNGLNVSDATGCLVFCHTDANGDGEISLAEREARFLRCTGGDRG